VPARVVEVRFLGRTQRVLLEAAGVRLDAEAPVDEPLAAGDRVGVVAAWEAARDLTP
jgi:hypothetical protein